MAKFLLLSWIILGVCFVFLLTQYQRAALFKELVEQSNMLSQQASQRANQHDAHLTGLSAVALADQNPNESLFLKLAAAIQQFYPRITAVDLVSLSNHQEVITSRLEYGDLSDLHNRIRNSAIRSDGKLTLLQSPVDQDHYLLIKRVPNSEEARYGLALEIDAQLLFKTNSSFWRQQNTMFSVFLPDGTSLDQKSSHQTVQQSHFIPLSYENVLNSRTQPLSLVSRVELSTAKLIPIIPFVLGLFIIGVILALGMYIYRLYSNNRLAELRARLSEQDAKISQASRINTMGELASGLAHELTQPLTAILSQSQAGLRIAKNKGEQPEELINVLNTNVIQAKRASSILKRLRSWTQRSTDDAKPVDVNESIRNVLFLLESEFNHESVQLTVDLSPVQPLILGDSVELEQVIFNLIRNALDKQNLTAHTTLFVNVYTRVVKNQIIIEIKDSGLHIESEMLDRIFEPFVSGKENGMGLGLALCDRIIDRMNGEIEIVNDNEGVIARVRFPLTEVSTLITS